MIITADATKYIQPIRTRMGLCWHGRSRVGLPVLSIMDLEPRKTHPVKPRFSELMTCRILMARLVYSSACPPHKPVPQEIIAYIVYEY